MNEFKIKIVNREGNILAESEYGENVILTYSSEYKDGDRICIEASATGLFCDVRLDDTMLPAIVHIKEKSLDFVIPFDEKKYPYSPKSFSGDMHVITAKLAEKDIVYSRRNLVFNPYDTHLSTNVFPHASANIETRGESVFAARNVIDGIYANIDHGKYPYQSWGINRRPDAELRIDFGMNVEIDEVRVTLRADFPHDNYWVKGTLAFSDGTEEIFEFEKTHLPQIFKIDKKNTEYIIFKDLIQSEEESPFPALTQIEAWGHIV